MLVADELARRQLDDALAHLVHDLVVVRRHDDGRGEILANVVLSLPLPNMLVYMTGSTLAGM